MGSWVDRKRGYTFLCYLRTSSSCSTMSICLPHDYLVLVQDHRLSLGVCIRPWLDVRKSCLLVLGEVQVYYMPVIIYTK